MTSKQQLHDALATAQTEVDNLNNWNPGLQSMIGLRFDEVRRTLAGHQQVLAALVGRIDRLAADVERMVNDPVV